jgi:hypothetical protein
MKKLPDQPPPRPSPHDLYIDDDATLGDSITWLGTKLTKHPSIRSFYKSAKSFWVGIEGCARFVSLHSFLGGLSYTMPTKSCLSAPSVPTLQDARVAKEDRLPSQPLQRTSQQQEEEAQLQREQQPDHQLEQTVPGTAQVQVGLGSGGGVRR